MAQLNIEEDIIQNINVITGDNNKNRQLYYQLKRSINKADKEGYAIALRDELKSVIENIAFKEHMKDILKYRTMEYYRRRYEVENF